MKRKFFATAAVVGVIGLAAPAIAAEITLRLGHPDAQASYGGVGADALARHAAELSNGAIEIQVFHGGQLGALPAEIAGTFDGSQDMVMVSPEFLGSYVDEARAVALPFLYDSVDMLQKFYLSDRWQAALKKIDEAGGVVLDKTWSGKNLDPRGVLTRDPVFAPADLTGLKMRIWESNVAISTWNGLGANTIVVPRPEMYLALQQGMIDAGPETIGIAYDQKNVEVLKYWTRTDEYFQIVNFWINRDRFNGLTPEQQGWLTQAAELAAHDLSAESELGYSVKRTLARLEHGVSIIEPSPQVWLKFGEPIIAKLIADGEVKADIVDYIRTLR